MPKRSKKKSPDEQYYQNPNTEKEDELADEVLTQFKASYLVKDNDGLHSDWAEYEEYYSNRSNLPEDDDDPGSENNIILPVVESQVADLINEPMDIMVKGVEPSDHFFASDVKTVVEWVLDKNQMVFKMDEHERNRLKFGTGIWKVWFDPNALKGRGLPIIEPICPSNFFPDPKIKRAWQLEDCEFIIQAGFVSKFSLRRRFGKRAKAVMPQQNISYNMELFRGEDSSQLSATVNDRAVLLERWSKEIDDKTGELYLRLVCVASGVVLYDSKWDENNRGYKGYYRKCQYPFVVTPCYARKGMIWGMGDAELLKPVQDMINELDDQIRMNARLMGNVQIVVGLASGINPKRWTNKPGLKLPARDHTAWQTVQPPNIPEYILARRSEGKLEAQEYSGRTDAVEGRRPGGIRAASAIMALQEAGGRRLGHKKLFLQLGLNQVLQLVIGMVAEHYTEEMAFRIMGQKSDEYLWFRGSTLNEIPKLIPGIPDDEGYSDLVPLMDEGGQNPATKEAEFDLMASIGAGLPQNKSFIYQSVVELHREGLITQQEARMFLKEIMSFPIIDPLNPKGQFTGRNMSPEMMQMANGMPMDGMGMDTPEGMMGPQPEDIPPEFLNDLVQRMGGGNLAV